MRIFLRFKRGLHSPNRDLGRRRLACQVQVGCVFDLEPLLPPAGLQGSCCCSHGPLLRVSQKELGWCLAPRVQHPIWKLTFCPRERGAYRLYTTTHRCPPVSFCFAVAVDSRVVGHGTPRGSRNPLKRRHSVANLSGASPSFTIRSSGGGCQPSLDQRAVADRSPCRELRLLFAAV